MKSTKMVLCGLIGISVLMLSVSTALSGVRQDVDKNTVDIADIKAKIDGLPDLEKRVEALEKIVAEHESDIANNKGLVLTSANMGQKKHSLLAFGGLCFARNSLGFLKRQNEYS